MMPPLLQRLEHGTISQIDYNLNHIDTFHHDTFGDINYCNGRLIYTNQTYLDVTFVFYDNHNSARDAFLYLGRINHDRVVRSWALSRDEITLDYFVAFDRFDRFLQIVEESFLTRSNAVPGNPSKNVQLHIIELTEALKHMQSRGMSSSFLADTCGYVWCGDTLKIFMVDRCIHSYDNVYPDLWSWMLETDISRFGDGIKKYILLNDDLGWTQKDNFMRCFDPFYINDISPALRLDMISQHPFLKDDVEKILQMFSTLQRALVECRFHGHDILRIQNTIINNHVFFDNICPRPSMRHPQVRVRLRDVDFFTLEAFVRWLSNQYEHCRDECVDMGPLYTEINEGCPLLIPMIHEAIFQADISHL